MCGYVSARKKKRHDIDRKIVERERKRLKIPVFGNK
jgi:hypothetical protein